MAGNDFAVQLDRFGPPGSDAAPMKLSDAQDFCRRLARRHYENFTVASWLLPRRLRQHFCNIYAYCRWADDLADEVHDPSRSLALLDWWLAQLDACYRGRALHPVFVALMPTIEEFDIPRAPFVDLLAAFRQDQRINRYETFDELLAYCRRSANPVGRLVLYLGRCHNDDTVAPADSLCTGLQLANFWQDVARDYDRDRIYLPRESCRRFRYTDQMFARREFNDAFRQLLEAEVARAESYLTGAWPLVDLVTPELRVDVELFLRGGMAVLQAIRRLNYNVWRKRPRVGKLRKLALLASAWRNRRGGRR